MKISNTQIALLLLAAILLGYLGSMTAGHWMSPQGTPAGMHEFVHRELNLSSQQEARLADLEDAFAVERRRLESNLKAANARLAAAMGEEHEYGPKVGAAVDDVHARMGDLQKATIRHAFHMRELLDSRQRRAFDRQVRTALTTDPDE
jgi:hypothetical protein